MSNLSEFSQQEHEALEFQRRIGANIRNWRERRTLATWELARLCGRPIAAIERIESGEEMPSLEFLWQAARIMRVPCLALTDQHDHRSAA